jgi:hypothetical protein
LCGCTERTNNERIPKQIAIVRMEGSRKRQRPQKRWTNEAEENMKILGIRNWHKMARGLEEWKRTVLESKVHNRM